MRKSFLVLPAAGAALALAAPAGATSFTTAQLGQASAGLQAMRELNLIVFNDLTSGAEVEGKTFVGGSISGNAENFGIGSVAHPSQGFTASSRDTLTVGGNVGANIQINNGANGTSGKVATGSDNRGTIGGSLTGTATLNATPATLRIGGSMNGQNFNPNASKTATYGTTVSNIQTQDAAYITKDASLANAATGLAATIASQRSTLVASLSQLSSVLGSLTTNATFNTSDHNNLHLDYSSAASTADFVVANVNASDLMGYSGTLNLNLLGNAGAYKTTVINVIGAGDYTYLLNNNDNQGSNNQNVIWNFQDASSIALNSFFHGSLLATNSTVSNQTAVEGSVVASAFRQNGEVHLGTFAGTSAIVPAPSTTTGAVPEAATWAMMVIGFGAIGGTIRSQRRRAQIAA